MALIFVQETELRKAQRGRVHTLTQRRTRYGDNGDGDSCDGGGDQRQEGASDDGDDPETRKGGRVR